MHKEMEKLSDDLQAAMKRVAALESALQASREEQRATALQVNPTDIVDAKVSEMHFYIHAIAAYVLDFGPEFSLRVYGCFWHTHFNARYLNP